MADAMREWKDLPIDLLPVVSRVNYRACSRAIRELLARISLAEAQHAGDSDEQIAAKIDATTPLYRALGLIVYNFIDSLPAKDRLILRVNSSTEREKRAFVDVLLNLATTDDSEEENGG